MAKFVYRRNRSYCSFLENKNGLKMTRVCIPPHNIAIGQIGKNKRIIKSKQRVYIKKAFDMVY
jgi:hypothetical protein